MTNDDIQQLMKMSVEQLVAYAEIHTHVCISMQVIRGDMTVRVHIVEKNGEEHTFETSYQFKKPLTLSEAREQERNNNDFIE